MAVGGPVSSRAPPPKLSTEDIAGRQKRRKRSRRNVGRRPAHEAALGSACLRDRPAAAPRRRKAAWRGQDFAYRFIKPAQAVEPARCRAAGCHRMLSKGKSRNVTKRTAAVLRQS